MSHCQKLSRDTSLNPLSRGMPLGPLSRGMPLDISASVMSFGLVAFVLAWCIDCWCKFDDGALCFLRHEMIHGLSLHFDIEAQTSSCDDGQRIANFPKLVFVSSINCRLVGESLLVVCENDHVSALLYVMEIVQVLPFPRLCGG